ncbi:hypothetical protein PSQ90_05810 [Devosia rhodophyticola]|uniref:M24 family metallopeptidase n=1 Tax=Devosia rhodophyticola TaxID=3026423 RepID=A0ABY7Z0M2_9HYPH|nr:hypothetical protein [Devosia rhodophyticola]WDR06957.1 hypothetical protein PSQ90_05810 [Devosia rhodophyticola]
MSVIRAIPKPLIELPTDRPFVPTDEFAARIETAIALLKKVGLDFFVVYGDRERAGDLHFLSGVDPRFEEGLLVLSSTGDRTIILGNENLGYAPDKALGISVELYQEFSPQGQLRDQSTQISGLLKRLGLSTGSKVGVVGGKYLSSGFVTAPEKAFGVPSYLVDELRAIVGEGNISNAQKLFVSPDGGLRNTNTAHQIAEFEYAAAHSSMSVHAASAAITVGARADHVADHLFNVGLQLSTHPMVNFGDKVARALSSPTPQVIAMGDAFQIAYGLKGTLTCRSGMVARNKTDLSSDAGDFFEAITLNYFDTVIAWYKALRLGAAAGDVYAAADAVRDADLFKFALNPGHTLHYEEWLDTPFNPGSKTKLVSGMVLQADIIPDYQGPQIGLNIEDGLVLADATLQKSLADLYPRVFERMQKRRNYVREVIGVELDPSVLLLSNTPLWHAPYVLDMNLALTAS